MTVPWYTPKHGETPMMTWHQFWPPEALSLTVWAHTLRQANSLALAWFNAPDHPVYPSLSAEDLEGPVE